MKVHTVVIILIIRLISISMYVEGFTSLTHEDIISSTETAYLIGACAIIIMMFVIYRQVIVFSR